MLHAERLFYEVADEFPMQTPDDEDEEEINVDGDEEEDGMISKLAHKLFANERSR